ncbi:MAG: TrkA family potassium uptake protein [Spirochaetales bacterium]|nr:TrkA family potassium uptake protein [Spirochaetales bacterium]
MKKQFAIIGVDKFGKRMIDELSSLDCEILIIDKDPAVVELWKDKVDAAFIADVFSQETIEKLIPSDIDAVIVDLGNSQEVSILVTNYLHKAGIKKIVVRAGTDEHGEILKIVGATDVIFPSREAARRLTPLLAAPLMVNYLPLSPGFILAEVKAARRLVGQTIFDADMKKDGIMNIIAIRNEESMDYNFSHPDYVLKEDDFLLVAGNQKDIIEFSNEDVFDKSKKNNKKGIFSILGWKTTKA